MRLPHRDDPATWPPKKRWVGPDEVIIPRAEYEAYRAAAKVLRQIRDKTLSNDDFMEKHRALAALRAAGIDLSEDSKQ